MIVGFKSPLTGFVIDNEPVKYVAPKSVEISKFAGGARVISAVREAPLTVKV